jgi:ribonuclease J
LPDALPVVVLIQSGEFERTDRVRRERIYPEEMRARSHELVMTCRASMLGELVSADCLDGASAVWSMWAGYLDRRSGRRADLRRLGIPLVIHHGSGHASPRTLDDFVRTLRPERVVPVHTDAPEAPAARYENAVLVRDGELWSV